MPYAGNDMFVPLQHLCCFLPVLVGKLFICPAYMPLAACVTLIRDHLVYDIGTGVKESCSCQCVHLGLVRLFRHKTVDTHFIM